MPPLRVDGNRRWARIKLMGGEVCSNGPFWLTQSAGDLQQSNAIFVTNGEDVWPAGGVLGLYESAESMAEGETGSAGSTPTTAE